MRHCCSFLPDDVYYLEDNIYYTDRQLSIGFCPSCQKPIAEIVQKNIAGDIVIESASGPKANRLVQKYKEDIIFSMNEVNYDRFKYKPYGWKYGVNVLSKENGKKVIKQYACDFYGNKELIKTTA